MHFLNPLYLFGLIAAAIPIIIHLLIIRKNKLIEFSTLRFLKELQKSEVRRLKLKQILLLILRTLVIVFLILAFSRPVIQSEIPFLRNYSNISSVIIIDNSISMDISDEYGNRFRQAKNFARSIIENLKEGDQAEIIFTSDLSQDENFTSNPSIINDKLAKTSISVIPSSFEKALRKTQKILDQSKNFAKEVFIVSDFQKSSLLTFSDSTKFFDENTNVNLIQIGYTSKIDIKNVSIDTIIPLTRIFEPEKPVEFEVRLHNSSKSTVENLVLSLLVNGERTAQRTVNLQPNSYQSVNIFVTPKQTGIYKCLFEIESDALDYDNRKWYSFVVPPLPNIALISQNPKGFLSSFLNSLNGKKINLDLIDPNQLSSFDFTKYQALIIESLNLNDLGWAKILNSISQGKGMLLFPDPKLDVVSTIRSLKQLNFPVTFEYKSFATENRPIITFFDKNHPLFWGVFRPTENTSLETIERPNINSFLTMNGGIPIVQTNAGSLISELKFNEANILYCSVPPTMDWSNFAVTSLFPVFVYRSIFYLTAVGEVNFSVRCGTKLSINLPKSLTFTNQFILEDPLGNRTNIQVITLPFAKQIEVSDLVLIGPYILEDSKGKPVGAISVNVDPNESKLELADKNSIIKYFKNSINHKAQVRFIEKTKEITEADFRSFAGTELWKLFIFLAILCAIAEMIIARTRKKELVNY
ncbi:MAG: BatA domain-containing protein [Ignavibacteria bacterium]|nr:BatA domain-containing protein [Ignavibacteria bacterium]